MTLSDKEVARIRDAVAKLNRVGNCPRNLAHTDEGGEAGKRKTAMKVTLYKCQIGERYDRI